MKSAFECFQCAVACEDRARTSPDALNRMFFLEAAKHWRTLGESAKRLKRSGGASADPVELAPARGPDRR